MRIANNTIIGNYLTGLNSTNSQYGKTIEQSDGSKLHRASDNDVGYAKYLRYQNDLTDNEQLTNNIKSALSWMKASDATLVNITGRLEIFAGKVVKAANSDNNISDMKDIAKELTAIVQEIIADLNSRVEDRYVFGGQADMVLPFSISDSKTPRAEAITLDDNQAKFFNRVNTGSVTQMLRLNGSDGTKYCYDTATGDLYTEEFVRNGYKDVLATGRTTVDRATDTVQIGGKPANIPMVGISATGDYSINGTKALDTEEQKEFFGTDALYAVCKNNALEYYADADGNLYEPGFVNSGYQAVKAAGQEHVSKRDGSPYNIHLVGKYDVPAGSAAETIFGAGTTLNKISFNGGTYYEDANHYIYNTSDVETIPVDVTTYAGMQNKAVGCVADSCMHVATKGDTKVVFIDKVGKTQPVNPALFGGQSALPVVSDGSTDYYYDTQTGFFFDAEALAAVEALGTPPTASEATAVLDTADKPLLQSFTYQEDSQLDAKQKLFFGTNSLQKLIGNDGNAYYRDSATNQVYTADFVESGYEGCGHATVIPSDAVYNSKNLLNLNIDSRGLLKDTYGKPGIVSNIPGLSFTVTTYEQAMVQYNGDPKYISMPSQIGLSNPDKDSVNATGQDLFGMDIFETGDEKASGSAMINDLLTVIAKIEDGDYNWVSAEGITLADKAHATVIKAQTKLAARQKSYNDIASMLSTQNETIKSDITDVSSADIGELATELMAYNKAYNLSLNIGARILPMSLLEYLR